MIYALFFIISFGASIIGAICGVGGGIVIKPLLDAFGVLSVSVISFLSGCTVLAMSAYSVAKHQIAGTSTVDMRTATPLAIGAAIGGVLGASLFNSVASLFADRNTVGAVQAIVLGVLTICVLVYTLNVHRLRTHHVRQPLLCGLIGLALGVLSSFLGIGGGPFNLMVLSFFFSLRTKEAAQSSLYIILFSQSFSVLNKLITGTVPAFAPWLLVLMICGGLLGGILGQRIHTKVSSAWIQRLYIGFIVVTIGINVYNVVQFLA